MPKLNALSRLLNGLRREHHDFQPSLQTFPDLNPDRIAAEFDLEAEGESRAKRNLPPSDSLTMDEVELRIVHRIESQKQSAHDTVTEELRVYDARLNALEFQERFNAIRNAAPAAASEFAAQARQGRSELHLTRRHIQEVESERDKFKEKHRIQRVSRQTGGGLLTAKLGFLAILLVFEIAINGVFLSKGSELGLVGGVVEALSFALLNILVSFGIAWGGIRWINHRTFFFKVFGILAIAFYFVFAVVLNLALAHYREISGSLVDDAGREVMLRLQTAPWGLADMKSWLFFGIGVVFSVAAVIDALLLFDPYPGFGALQQRVLKAHKSYNAHYAMLIDELRDIRDEAITAMDEASRDLALRRGEYDAILQGRSRVVQLFASHQDLLEKTGNRLLSIYHAANSRTRPENERPSRFNIPYTMERITLSTGSEVVTDCDELKLAIRESNTVLGEQMASIHRTFDEEIRSYKEIDELLPEGNNAASPSALA